VALAGSFQDRERVPKIQGLLNECMTFLDDELSVITRPYEKLLSIDEVIEQELILLVALNVNKNTDPVRALGKMLLQNLQLVVGKRYESEEQRRLANRPMFSVVVDEFAPFGFKNFSQILQTATGTNSVPTQDRNKLQEELTQNSSVVADLSMRVEALSKKVNGNSGLAIYSGNSFPERSPDDTDSSATATVCMPSDRRTDA
jgi:hypothetical protein